MRQRCNGFAQTVGCIAVPVRAGRWRWREVGAGPDRTAKYPGTCRGQARATGSWRVLVAGEPLEFRDLIQGWQEQDLAREVGDFVVRRADGQFSYQLAVVVDDAEQGITEVIRGCDILPSTGRQMHLQRLLGLPTPLYGHVPVVLGEDGQKLSKQNLAPQVRPEEAAAELCRALRFLGQSPPPELSRSGIRACWEWARTHWSLEKVPPVESLPATPSHG